MAIDRWLLPAGVEEVLPARAATLERLRRRLLDLFSAWGYTLVIPPFLEYLDALQAGAGADLDLQTFKVIDQLSGRLMGVRADMTPQVARIDARHSADAPARLCYLGTVLHALPDGVSGSRSPVQVGAELYGHAGPESDCEVLCLMLETLEAAGIRHVHLDLGHVGVFRALARSAGLGAEREEELHEALQRKALPEIRGLLAGLECSSHVARMMLALAELNGGIEVLGRAREVLGEAGSDVLAGLDRLAGLAQELARRKPQVTMHVDLAELRGYRYHTGTVFAAFVPGHGQGIARGGRYDDIGHVFGRARPATGFSTDLKILAALGGDANPVDTGEILAPWSSDPALLARVAALRAAGERVVYDLPGAELRPLPAGCARRLELHAGAWEVRRVVGVEGPG